ncbi:MAG: hypothetical protein U0792_07590 [Gemmataceae bacterium]
MIGVDSTLGDLNSFGASIVFALPDVAAKPGTRNSRPPAGLAMAGYVGCRACASC